VGLASLACIRPSDGNNAWQFYLFLAPTDAKSKGLIHLFTIKITSRPSFCFWLERK
jgi:hypothetical protein